MENFNQIYNPHLLSHMRKVRQFLRFAALTNAAVLFHLHGGAALADAITGDSVTINPTGAGAVPVLTLEAPADSSQTTGSPTLTLSYSDSATSTTTSPTGFLILNRPNANLEWHIANADGSTRLQMQLGSGNTLTLSDPANAANGIMLNPGGLTPGISLNGSPFLTQIMADQRYLGLNGGNIVLGSSGPQSISTPPVTGEAWGNSLTIKAGDAGSVGSNGGGNLILSGGGWNRLLGFGDCISRFTWRRG